MKVLVLNGSPKKKSDTFRLTDAFLKGLNRSGGHEISIIPVIEKEIAPCRGCFGCWKRLDGHCVIQDDQNAILDLYRGADVILWSFPLYCYGMPSHLKAVLDRTIPLLKMNMCRRRTARSATKRWSIFPESTRWSSAAAASRTGTAISTACGRCAGSVSAARTWSACRRRLS